MLTKKITADFEAHDLMNDEWRKVQTLTFEVSAESEDALWEEAHMRCEAVACEIERDNGFPTIYQWKAIQ